MRTASLLSPLLVGLLACGPSADVHAEHSQGLQALGADTHDAGIVVEGERIEAEFWFQNVSTESCRIGRIQKTCGCSEATIDKEVLGPGEVGLLKVAVDTSTRPGNLRVSVLVGADHADHGTLVFHVTGRVGRPSAIEIEPSRIDFGELQRGARATRSASVVLKSRWGAELDPEPTWSIEGPDAGAFVIEYLAGSELTPDGDFLARRGELRIGFQAGATGSRANKLELRCGGTPTPVHAAVTLVATVRGAVELERPALFFDGLALGEERQALVDIAWREARLGGEIAPESTADWLSCRLVEGGAHGLGRLEVGVAPARAGFHEGEVQLRRGPAGLTSPESES